MVLLYLITAICSNPPAAADKIALSKFTLQAGEPSGTISIMSFDSNVNNGYPGGCATLEKIEFS